MQKLSELRLSKNITQEQIANKLGIGISTYCQYEKSQRNIPIKIAERIASILNVEVNEIFLPVRFTVSKNNRTTDKTS